MFNSIFKGETDERENELLRVSISSTFPSGITTNHIDGTVIQLSTFSLRKSLWLWYFHPNNNNKWKEQNENE